MSLKDQIAKKLAAGLLVIEKLPAEVAETEAAKRKEICDGCEKRDTQRNVCTVCKCFLEIKQTTLRNLNLDTMKQEVTHCPLGKWNDGEIALFYRKEKIEKT